MKIATLLTILIVFVLSLSDLYAESKITTTGKFDSLSCFRQAGPEECEVYINEEGSNSDLTITVEDTRPFVKFFDERYRGSRVEVEYIFKSNNDNPETFYKVLTSIKKIQDKKYQYEPVCKYISKQIYGIVLEAQKGIPRDSSYRRLLSNLNKKKFKDVNNEILADSVVNELYQAYYENGPLTKNDKKKDIEDIYFRNCMLSFSKKDNPSPSSE